MGRDYQATTQSAGELDLSETLSDADCVVITTNHKTFDIDFIVQHAHLIVDLRNIVDVCNTGNLPFIGHGGQLQKIHLDHTGKPVNGCFGNF